MAANTTVAEMNMARESRRSPKLQTGSWDALFHSCWHDGSECGAQETCFGFRHGPINGRWPVFLLHFLGGSQFFSYRSISSSAKYLGITTVTKFGSSQRIFFCQAPTRAGKTLNRVAK
jgi:hypothetical protein